MRVEEAFESKLGCDLEQLDKIVDVIFVVDPSTHP
jgi:hypothetical protein